MKSIISASYISAILFLLMACTGKSPEGIDAYYLPDLNVLFDGYDDLDSTAAYAAFGTKLVRANRDLQASQLYIEAASMYQQAGNTDSVVYCLHKAIDRGMANPNILSRLGLKPGVHQGQDWKRLYHRLDSIQAELMNVANFSLEIDAMQQFWPYFERAKQDKTDAKKIFKEFIFEGPREIRDFYVVRYNNTEAMYGQIINAAPAYYSNLQRQFDPERLLALKDITTEGMHRFKKLYPQAVFPKVFVVPGILNSGGTATEMGLFVGGDMYGKSEATPMEELTDWQQGAIMEVSSLPAITLHELMHFQQNYADPVNKDNVLFNLVQEGVCDLLVEICTRQPLKNSNLEYLDDPFNREKIMADLKSELFGEDLSAWLYNGESIQDRPHDLGYTLGYLITKSYYENHEDKQQAIYELLNSKDLTVIVRESDYAFLLEQAI